MVLLHPDDASGRRSSRNHLPRAVRQVALQKRYRPAAMDDTTLADEHARFRRPEEIDLELYGGTELVRREHGGERGAQRIVEHRRYKATLNISLRVGELFAAIELDPEAPAAGYCFERLPAKQFRGRRHGQFSRNGFPEWVLLLIHARSS